MFECAEHLVKCSLAPGRRKVHRKPLSELCVNGNYTEDREEWQRELERPCEEVCTDQNETREEQEKNWILLIEKGDRHFAEDGKRSRDHSRPGAAGQGEDVRKQG